MTDDLDTAIQKTAEQVVWSIDGEIDLVFAFAAGYSASEFDRCMIRLKELTGTKIVLGCSCESAIGNGCEFEHETGLSLWAASLPNAELTPMNLNYVRSNGEAAFVGWPESTDGDWPDDSVLVMLGEPFGFPIDVLLEQLNEDRPGVRLTGGMASGAQVPGDARLLLDDQAFSDGAVAVRISGTTLKTIVSQGCRPIGEPMVITKSERNVVEQLGGKLALDVIYEIFQTLPTREQKMFQSGLHLGRVINEYQDKFEFGDFLIRNVVGIDKELRSISIGDYVRPGQTVQFHIRDAESASAELSQMLANAANKGSYQSALLFTCNGRGMNLFPDPHHDADLVHSCGGDSTIPMAGFFAAGEIGNVGDKNFLHGFTASVLFFE